MDRDHPILGFFHGWVEAFAKHAERVDVIVLQAGTYDLPDHVRVFSLGKESGTSKLGQLARFYYYLTRSFFALRPTHVFFHMGAIMNVLASPFWLLRGITRTKFFWWKAHGHINWFGRFAGWFVDRIYTSTSSGFPIETKKRWVIGQAIDPEYFTPDPGARISKHVLYVGRISPLKKIEEFIATARILEPKGYTFTIVGPVCDAAYETELKHLAKDTMIDFAGPKPPSELRHYYHQAAIFLNPSQTHSMDKTVLEAVLSGCIPVTSNIAFRELLEPHGLFVTETVGQQFAAVIEGLTAPEQLRSEIRDAVVTSHSLHTFAKRIFGTNV